MIVVDVESRQLDIVRSRAHEDGLGIAAPELESLDGDKGSSVADVERRKAAGRIWAREHRARQATEHDARVWLPRTGQHDGLLVGAGIHHDRVARMYAPRRSGHRTQRPLRCTGAAVGAVRGHIVHRTSGQGWDDDQEREQDVGQDLHSRALETTKADTAVHGIGLQCASWCCSRNAHSTNRSVSP